MTEVFTDFAKFQINQAAGKTEQDEADVKRQM